MHGRLGELLFFCSAFTSPCLLVVEMMLFDCIAVLFVQVGRLLICLLLLDLSLCQQDGFRLPNLFGGLSSNPFSGLANLFRQRAPQQQQHPQQLSPQILHHQQQQQHPGHPIFHNAAGRFILTLNEHRMSASLRSHPHAQLTSID